MQINEISKKESIPTKFLEQILLSLKNIGILSSKRGSNGGYLLSKSCDKISIGMIIEIFEGPFDPIGMNRDNHLSPGLEKCFGKMVEIVNEYLNEFTIQDVLEIEQAKTIMAFEI